MRRTTATLLVSIALTGLGSVLAQEAVAAPPAPGHSVAAEKPKGCSSAPSIPDDDPVPPAEAKVKPKSAKPKSKPKPKTAGLAQAKPKPCPATPQDDPLPVPGA
ncbi:MAG: hypothetical protein J2P18_07735 [Nocardia sp.]|nr:hypothetical protein [Nocardia sp.]